jgi:lysozyme
MRTRRTRRRWPYVLVVFAICAGAIAAWGRYRTLPAYRPALGDGERFGVDVSNHQGHIDWNRVAADDIGFAYIKATEGGDFVDDWFTRNWDGAGAAGLARGAYHFFTLCRSGADQADNFLRAMPRDPDALPPVVDLELGGNCGRRPDRAWVEREVHSFLDRVDSATGRTTAVYLLDDFDDVYHLREGLDRPQWLRRILLRPEGDDWWIWQVSGFAAVDGISGQADLNVMLRFRP